MVNATRHTLDSRIKINCCLGVNVFCLQASMKTLPSLTNYHGIPNLPDFPSTFKFGKMSSFVIHTIKTWRRVDGGQHHKFIRGWNWLLETSQVPLWYLWLISVYEWKPSTSKDTHGNPYTSRLWSTWLDSGGWRGLVTCQMGHLRSH